VADAGSHTIKKIKPTGEIQLIAGVENQAGYADGESRAALFLAPVGVAVLGEKIYVADTYNDRIRVIEPNGVVSTVAGSEQGFADGDKFSAKFDTPCGIAALGDGKLIVADLGNRRLRIVETSGRLPATANGIWLTERFRKPF
jgi:DNA-binding beta-propeller fold protein YncE